MPVDAEDNDLCCVSHAFFRCAARSPGRIAAVHTAGGVGEESWGARARRASSPPVYEGDQLFTCGEVLSAVVSLSRRIRRVLDGGDDPGLRRPRDDFKCKHIMIPSVGNDGIKDGSPNHYTPQVVGVYMVPSVEYIVAVLSIIRCGVAFLPLDPLWPEDRILSVVSSSKTSLIVRCPHVSQMSGSQESDASDWFVDRGNCLVLYLSMKVGLEEQVGQSELEWPCEAKSQRSFCYLMYTSGSTGQPKGVCGTEKGLLNRFRWMQEKIPVCREEVLLFKTSISFVDHLQEFLSGVLTCTTLIIPPYNELKAYPAHIINLIEAYGISRLTAVPSLMRVVLPSLEGQCQMPICKLLKVLILSGEVFSISLWKALHQLLPQTAILNLYGSTEVSGDCAYFDCRDLPSILVSETLNSVPIGLPISNCELVLVAEPGTPDEGEICVAGECLFAGYFDEPINVHAVKNDDTRSYFKTGDFAKCLRSGEFVFLGRKDRTVKVNGQRVALEEIEHTIREHPEVSDAAVTIHKIHEKFTNLEAYIVPKDIKVFHEGHVLGMGGHDAIEDLILSIQTWLLRKLPLVMIPNCYTSVEVMPISTSGKIDYTMLAGSSYTQKRHRSANESNNSSDIYLQKIKEVFSQALMVNEVTDHDDFFAIGGNSVLAAHAAHKLGIDMRLIYIFPRPLKLLKALVNRTDLQDCNFIQNLGNVKRLKSHENVLSSFETTGNILNNGSPEGSVEIYTGGSVEDLAMEPNGNQPIPHFPKNDFPLSACSLKMDSSLPFDLKPTTVVDSGQWLSNINSSIMCSFSRCNQLMLGGILEYNYVHEACLYIENPKGSLQELWKVPLKSCVDASPLVILRDGKIKLFIGSHSCIFLCVDVLSCSVQWEVKLEDRIECSAAITGDFLQIVVGCYKGKIYFLDFLSGNICWVYQTDGEVKMQPVADRQRNLMWCGSHDHWLYALDYKKHCCVYKAYCGGSIFGSPSINKVNNMVCVASTSGIVTAISVKVQPYRVMWQYESGAPIFGSLALDSLNGHVICCSVDGHVTALDLTGTVIWKASTGGPIFAGACISHALPSQVLVCSRNGDVYSFDLEDGSVIWEYQVGDPITSSAYVDEHFRLTSEPSQPCYRLACICSSSGSILVLRVNANAKQDRINQVGDSENLLVQEAATVNLPGEIFSSPVMISGRIFVGCRDDYLHCIAFVS